MRTFLAFSMLYLFSISTTVHSNDPLNWCAGLLFQLGRKQQHDCRRFLQDLSEKFEQLSGVSRRLDWFNKEHGKDNIFAFNVFRTEGVNIYKDALTFRYDLVQLHNDELLEKCGFRRKMAFRNSQLFQIPKHLKDLDERIEFFSETFVDQTRRRTKTAAYTPIAGSVYDPNEFYISYEVRQHLEAVIKKLESFYGSTQKHGEEMMFDENNDECT